MPDQNLKGFRVNEAELRKARTSPGKAMEARVGNYRAPVDTVGMEPEIKSLFAEGDKPNPGEADLGARMKDFFGGLFKSKQKGRPAPAAPTDHPKVNPPSFTSAQRDSMLKSWPGGR